MIWNKKGLEKEELGKWVIAIVLLVLLIAGIILLKDKMVQIGEYLKNFFKFG